MKGLDYTEYQIRETIGKIKYFQRKLSRLEDVHTLQSIEAELKKFKYWRVVRIAQMGMPVGNCLEPNYMVYCIHDLNQIKVIDAETYYEYKAHVNALKQTVREYYETKSFS